MKRSDIENVKSKCWEPRCILGTKAVLSELVDLDILAEKLR